MPVHLDKRDMESFASPPQAKVCDGPLTLYRLVQRNEELHGYGRYWFDAALFWEVMDFATVNAADLGTVNWCIRLLLREYTAVCYDWNSFAAILRMHVPAGQSIEVQAGAIKPQPNTSAEFRVLHPAPPLKMLYGGETQYILDVGTRERKLISGPMPLRVAAIGHA